MFYVIAFLFGCLVATDATSSPLVFTFSNPAFNSNSNSGDYLLDSAGVPRNGSGRHIGNSATPTYQIIELNNGALVLQDGQGNVSSITIQSGSGNSSETSQNSQ